MLYKMSAGMALLDKHVAETGKPYDLVIRMRPDMILHQPIARIRSGQVLYLEPRQPPAPRHRRRIPDRQARARLGVPDHGRASGRALHRTGDLLPAHHVRSLHPEAWLAVAGVRGAQDPAAHTQGDSTPPRARRRRRSRSRPRPPGRRRP